MEKQYFTVKEASAWTTLSVPTLRLYIRQGKLKASNVGRRIIINKRDLEMLIEKGGGEIAKAS